MLSEKADGKMAKWRAEEKKNKGGAPLGNQNNKKPPNEVKSAWLKMRVRPQDKSNWVRAAQSQGLSLSAYIEATMNKQGEK